MATLMLPRKALDSCGHTCFEYGRLNADVSIYKKWCNYLVSECTQFETNGRGTLHAHGVIVQPFLQPGRLEAIVADDMARSRLFRFLEQTAAQHFPTTSSPDEHALQHAASFHLPERSERKRFYVNNTQFAKISASHRTPLVIGQPAEFDVGV